MKATTQIVPFLITEFIQNSGKFCKSVSKCISGACLKPFGSSVVSFFLLIRYDMISRKRTRPLVVHLQPARRRGRPGRPGFSSPSLPVFLRHPGSFPAHGVRRRRGCVALSRQPACDRLGRVVRRAHLPRLFISLQGKSQENRQTMRCRESLTHHQIHCMCACATVLIS